MEPGIAELPAEPVSFREFRWSTAALTVGCLAIVAMRGVTVAHRWWGAAVPYWLWIVVGGLLPHAFLLVFPFVTRRPRPFRIRWPRLMTILREGGIAFLTLLLSLIVLGVANAFLESARPGSTLRAQGFQEMAYSSHMTITSAILLFSFVVAPFSEEIFFRGFLYNAFRARMPLSIALLLQAVLFGAGHTFGAGHAVAAGFLGLVFGLLYEWRKMLAASILAHGGMNLLASLAVFGLMAGAADSPKLGINGSVEPRGCVVEVIAPDSGAAQSNLQLGDVVAAIDDQPAPDYPTLAAAVRTHKAGDTVTLTVHRGEDTLFLKVVLQRRGP